MSSHARLEITVHIGQTIRASAIFVFTFISKCLLLRLYLMVHPKLGVWSGGQDLKFRYLWFMHLSLYKIWLYIMETLWWIVFFFDIWWLLLAIPTPRHALCRHAHTLRMFIMYTQTKMKRPIFMVLYLSTKLRCRNKNKTKMFIKCRTHKNW